MSIYKVIETIDREWMVLRNGFQHGGNIGSAGEGDATYKTFAEAQSEAIKAHQREIANEQRA